MDACLSSSHGYSAPCFAMKEWLVHVFLGVQQNQNWKCLILTSCYGFPNGSAGKEPACYAGETGDVGSIPKSGRCPGEGNDYTFQYSCLESPMVRGAWQATVHGVAKSRRQLSD